MKETVVDYVVVGGGSAGCVVASRLSEDPGVRVMLLEAGEPDSSPLLSIPGTVFRAAFSPRFGWGFMTEPQAQVDGRQLALVQAKVLGGGSSVNGMVYTRGAASDFDRWAHLGCEGWAYEDVLPYFMRTEASDRKDGKYHGKSGPVTVTRGRADLPIVKLFANALTQAGYALVDDLNVPAPDGFGYYDWTIRRGRRASTSAAYPGIRGGRKNLSVRTNARVLRVITSHGRAVAVEVAGAGNEVEIIRAEHEIILSAGAINTPRLLLLSGIGPAGELKELGLPVTHDLPGVGHNLQNHMTCRLEFEVKAPLTAYNYLNPLRGLRELILYAALRRGFLSYGSAPFGGFFRSSAMQDLPDMQLVFAPLLMGTRMSPIGPLPRGQGFSLFINQGRPFSRGFVRLRSSDPNTPPIIDPCYFSDPRDLQSFIEAVQRMRELASMPALASVISREVYPGPAAVTPEALANALAQGGDNHYHVSGTCRMGSDSLAVTNSQLQVRGIAGLRIADMSVAPDLVNGNTNAIAMMIGERAADFIRKG